MGIIFLTDIIEVLSELTFAILRNRSNVAAVCLPPGIYIIIMMTEDIADKEDQPISSVCPYCTAVSSATYFQFPVHAGETLRRRRYSISLHSLQLSLSGCRRSVSLTRDLHYHHDQEDTADKEDQPISSVCLYRTAVSSATYFQFVVHAGETLRRRRYSISLHSLQPSLSGCRRSVSPIGICIVIMIRRTLRIKQSILIYAKNKHPSQDMSL